MYVVLEIIGGIIENSFFMRTEKKMVEVHDNLVLNHYPKYRDQSLLGNIETNQSEIFEILLNEGIEIRVEEGESLD